ncbi:MAG: hypothetical protein U0V73_10320 [Acidimicrobiia bacterium]
MAAALAVGSALVAPAGTAPASAAGEPVIERYAGVGPGPGPATQMLVRANHLAAKGSVVYVGADDDRVLRIDLDARTAELVAGGGSDRGDGGPAADARLHVGGIAVHGTDLFVSDWDRSTVDRVDLVTGIISTYAGTPDTAGLSGDGGPAGAAQLSGPRELAVDGAGNLFVADAVNGRIRRVDHATHVITSIGDDGGGGPASVSAGGGLAVDPAGNVYLSEAGLHDVKRVDHASGLVTTIAGDGTRCADALQACGDGGAATAAQLASPMGLAIAGSTLFVADPTDLRIRAVDLGTGTISTVAGNGAQCRALEPCGDGGPATAASFSTLSDGLAVDGGGHLLTGDEQDGGLYLRSVSPGGPISTVAGAGFTKLGDQQGTFDARSVFLYPWGVTVGPDGTAYVANLTAVVAIAPGGTARPFAGGATVCADLTQACGDGGPATQANLAADILTRTAVGPDGSVYLTNVTKIRKVDPHGTITTVAGDGTQCADLAQACGDGGPATAARLTVATGIATDGAGNVYFLDVNDGYFNAGKVRRIDAHTGAVTTVAGDGTQCVDPATGCGDGGPATHAQIGGVALRADAAGNLYLADLAIGTIRRVDAQTGIITKVAGGGEATADGAAAADARLGPVYGFGVDGAGNVYAATLTDLGCSVVLRIDPQHTVHRFAGRRDACGWTGDGGPATAARFGMVLDVDAGPDGAVYVADTTNFAVRRVAMPSAPPITTTTTTTAPAPPPSTPGLWVIGGEASPLPLDGSGSFGQPGRLNSPLVDVASTSSGNGYWLVGVDGGVFACGDAGFFGSTGDRRLVAPIAGIAGTPTNQGYWLVAADGGVFAFGDAEFHGSTGGTPLNAPVRGLASTPSGNGYRLVAADGGVFAFGDAGYFGSMAGHRLSSPVVGLASTPSGNGYWLVAADGGVFAFGDAEFYGSMAGHPLNAPVARIVPTSSGRGYRLVARDGGVFAFGDAPGPS